MAAQAGELVYVDDDAVIDLSGNGFRVDDNASVNENGTTYYYAAFDCLWMLRFRLGEGR